MKNATGQLRKQYSEKYPEANRYKYRFLKNGKRGEYLSATYLLFCFNGNLYLFNAMLQLRYGLESIRRKKY